MDMENQQMIMSATLERNNALLRDAISFSELSNAAKNRFYDHDGNEHFIDLSREFNNGCCGRVYFLDEDNKRVFKKYYVNTLSDYRLKYSVFVILNEMRHPNIICPLEDYYDSKPDDLKPSIMAGYTYDYIIGHAVDLLYRPKDYLLENLRSIEKLFDQLAKEGVQVSDLKPDNVVLNENRIVIIDPDCFQKMPKEAIKYTSRMNKRLLLYLMRDLLSKNMGPTSFCIRDINSLFSSELEDEKDMTSFVAKRLMFKKRIIDYLK